MQQVQFSNGVALSFRFEDERFVGIGAVTCGNVALRSPDRAWWVEIRTPEGLELGDYGLLSCQEQDGGFDLLFSMQARNGRLMEWMLHEVRPRLNLDSWDDAPRPLPETTLALELRPVARTLGGHEFTGFSYRFVYRSESHPIYKILDRASWEIGGSVAGSEFWLRNGTTAPIARFASCEQAYSTEWYLPGIHNPNIFQFHPWQTQMQGFTFTAAPGGTLLTWASEVAHIRSLFQKKRGSDALEHWHEHGGDLSHEFQSAPIEVLFCPRDMTRIERINAWSAAFEMVSDHLHAQIGMRRERITTYGLIEEWGPADVARYAQRGVPRLLDAGVQMVALANQFQNNMSEFDVSNMCCTLDWQFPERLREPMKRLCERAHAGGAGVEMWGNTALSTLAWVFDSRRYHTAPQSDASQSDVPRASERIRFLPEAGSLMHALRGADDAWVRNASGALEADHYTPVFAALNLRDETVRREWHARWGRARDETGLDAIFLDSSFNMSSDKWHWVAAPMGRRGGATIDQTHLLGQGRPQHEPPAAILSQYHAHLSLMTEMQGRGYRIGGEDIGVFGVHRSGPGVATRLDNAWMWGECLAEWNAPDVERAGGNPDEMFFRGLAYRQMWILHWDIARDCLSWAYPGQNQPQNQAWQTPRAWQLGLLRAFNATNAHTTGEREILSDENGNEAGVIYRDGATRVLWAFADLTLTLELASRVVEVAGEQEVEAETSVLHARRHGVYLVKPT